MKKSLRGQAFKGREYKKLHFNYEDHTVVSWTNQFDGSFFGLWGVLY